MERVGTGTIAEMQAILKRFAKYPIDYPSELLQSMDSDVTFKSLDAQGTFKGLQVDVISNYYAIFLDAGRRAGLKWIPVPAALSFIRKRNLTQKFKLANGEPMEEGAIAYLVRRSIHRKGIEPRNFIKPALKKGIDDNRKQLGGNIAKDIVERHLLVPVRKLNIKR